MWMFAVTVSGSPEGRAGGYGAAQLGLFGGGGGISSESGSDGCFRDCVLTPWTQRSRYSKRICLVTGSWMLLQTAGERKTNMHSRREVITETLTGFSTHL
ncbi:hypothetical protein CHARACLAT_007065 [Characodon lateralis]|uniref:Secreted protein n=1 Tax=Characodon lateralis TaxID=208331 RepID=A0ABU7DQP8_9TELE|nr:hypothetical protein [Characodon lateralis]